MATVSPDIEVWMLMSKDLSEKWGYGVGRNSTSVDPRPRPQDAVVRLESGRWAPPLSGRNGAISTNGAVVDRQVRHEPVQPGQRSQPAQRSQSVQPSQPAQRSQPVQPGQPAQRSQPVQPGQRSQPAQRSQSVQPSQPAQRSQSVQPGQRSQPAQRSQSVQPSQPAQLDYFDNYSQSDRNGFDDSFGRGGRNGSSSPDRATVPVARDSRVSRDRPRPIDQREGQQSHRERSNSNSDERHYESARAMRARRAQQRTQSRSTQAPRRHDSDHEIPSRSRSVIEWAVVLGVSALIALLVQSFIAQAFWIPSSSMEATLAVDDKVFVDKVGYRISDINRGDIVVFHKTDEEIESRPDDPKDIIKRVIGLPGETVHIENNQVRIDGQLLVEPYLEEGALTSQFGPKLVPEGHLFVMGDNREHSADSRFELGPVSQDRVVGRAFVTFWPPSRIGGL